MGMAENNIEWGARGEIEFNIKSNLNKTLLFRQAILYTFGQDCRFEISCVCYFIVSMADKQPRRHDKKTLSLVLIATFSLKMTTKKVNLLKLFIFLFVLQQEHS